MRYMQIYAYFKMIFKGYCEQCQLSISHLINLACDLQMKWCVRTVMVYIHSTVGHLSVKSSANLKIQISKSLQRDHHKLVESNWNLIHWIRKLAFRLIQRGKKVRKIWYFNTKFLLFERNILTIRKFFKFSFLIWKIRPTVPGYYNDFNKNIACNHFSNSSTEQAKTFQHRLTIGN